MGMSGIGMIGCAVAYLVPLMLLIVILVKVNGVAKKPGEKLAALIARQANFHRSGSAVSSHRT